MPEGDLHVVLYFTTEDQALLSIVSELDELGVEYEECRVEDASETIRDELRAAGSGTIVSPTISVNGDLMPNPTAPNVMSSIMHARAGGFYQ